MSSELLREVDISHMKMLIVGLLLIIVMLIYAAPAVDESRADIQRAADQYGRQIR